MITRNFCHCEDIQQFTMASTIAIAVVAIVVYWIYSNISGLLKNIAAAKRSGLPYIIVRKYIIQCARCELTRHSCQSIQHRMADNSQAMGTPIRIPAGLMVQIMASVRIFLNRQRHS